MGVHIVGQNLGFPLAVCHREHDVKDLENDQCDCRPDNHNCAHDLWDFDFKEDFKRVGTIDGRSLDGFFGHAAQGRRQDNHRKASLNPDQHNHQKKEFQNGMVNHVCGSP